MSFLLMTIIGFLGGLASGLFGVGGGLIFVPLLMLLKGFDPHRAIATSLAIVVPTAIVAVFRHSLAGMVEWKSVPIIVVFALAGAWIGASLSVQMDTVLLRRLFSVFLAAVAVRIFFAN